MKKNEHLLKGVRVIGVLNSQELFGHERGNIEVFKALSVAGADVCVGVTTAFGGGAVRKEIETLGFGIFSIPFGTHWSKKLFLKNPLYVIWNIWRWLSSNVSVVRQVRRYRPTHFHMGSPFAFSFVGIAVRLSGVPLIVRLGDAPPVNSPIQMSLWRYFVGSASRVVANSAYVWRRAAGASSVLQSQTPSVIFNLATSGQQSPQPANYDPDFKHVVYVGQITRDKGVFEFVKAASILATYFPHLRFHLVGGSPYTTDTERELFALVDELKIGELIIFHGWVNNARNFLSEADVHVAPSVWEEPFANVVMEAKREGTPSVVFSSGGMAEMIRHQIDGYGCSGKSPESLAEGIRWVICRTVGEMSSLRATAAADCEERFGSSRFQNEWAKVYLNCAP
jgi:glycosyltransferase involved in cell wall biosynthesis